MRWIDDVRGPPWCLPPLNPFASACSREEARG